MSLLSTLQAPLTARETSGGVSALDDSPPRAPPSGSIGGVQERQRQPGRAFCPGCGQKYAVPEDELKRRAGLRFRATCRACDTPFSVMWRGDELVTEREEILKTDEENERDVL